MTEAIVISLRRERILTSSTPEYPEAPRMLTVVVVVFMALYSLA